MDAVILPETEDLSSNEEVFRNMNKQVHVVDAEPVREWDRWLSAIPPRQFDDSLRHPL